MPADNKARWEIVYDDLRRQIDQHKLAAGDQVPGELQLAELHDVSRDTVRNALRRLQQEGLVTEGKGRLGRTVREWKPLVYRPQSEFRKKPPTVDIFTNLLAQEGREGTQTIEVDVVLPDELIRQRLQLNENEPVAVRRRTSYVDGRPYATDDSYVAHRIVEGSEWMLPASIERGTNQVLAELGHKLVEALDEIYPRMPRRPEVERLSLPTGTPIAELISTAHDEDGQPIQVTVCLLPGDRHVIVYERRRVEESTEEATAEEAAE
ncbi:GntR family transcriptional regulator [Kitasatospora sp. NPDC088264]|uniref:GntR family transcriptional regulator n=1 Tax=Kitasatospora sp. NPDC088264 TaxID=3155296 RepID=UPI003440E6B1